MRNLVFIVSMLLALVSCTKAPTVVLTFRDVLALASFGVIILVACTYVTVLWIKGVLKWIEEKTRRETDNRKE